MKKVLSVVACAAIIGWVGSASASQSVVYDDSGAVFYTSGLTGYQTTDQDMTGMAFTFYFGDGSTATASWGNIPGSGDGVRVYKDNDMFELRMNGDSYYSLWDSSVAADDDRDGVILDKIFIDAGAGDSVFDVWAYSNGTAGSATGNPFYASSYGDDFNILATYSGRVALTGSNPVGDLYRYLTIDFTNGQFGPDRDRIDFFADTDSLAISGDLNPVPEPATMLLFGTGLVGLAAFGRRRAQK